MIYNDEYFMNLALKNAKLAYSKNEVPVGAVITLNNKVIASAYNLRETKNIIDGHAEILAINKACQKLKKWKLNNCILYVTLEPCLMCAGAILDAHISSVVFGAQDVLNGAISKYHIFDNNSNAPLIIKNVLGSECENLLTSFFKTKRK